MTIVAVLGDCATTTTVALAAAWPAEDDVVVLEADPRGGSLAAWLELPATPTLSTAVTVAPNGQWSAIETLVPVSPAGMRVLPAPVLAVEAARAVAEAEASLVPLLAARPTPVALIDVGDPPARPSIPVAVTHARALVVVHRQRPHSPRAEGVRVERRAAVVRELADVAADIVVAVVGARPFDPHDVGEFLVGDLDAVGVHLPDDPLTAAVIAGRSGVSARRLARLPLSRAVGRLASTVHELLVVPAASERPS